MRISLIACSNPGLGMRTWRAYVNVNADPGKERDALVSLAQKAAEDTDEEIVALIESVGVSVNIWIRNHASDVNPEGPIGRGRTLRAQQAAYRVLQQASDEQWRKEQRT